MIPTPDLSHLTKEDFVRIYDPAEDTFLLLDALEQDAEYLRARRPLVCVEIGSGSGCVTTFLGGLLKGQSCLILGTDINPHAARCTQATANQNGVTVHPIICDLVGPLQARLHRNIDILIFNPPYVPTQEEEAIEAQTHGDITSTWAGGLDGMVVTSRVLEDLDGILSDLGCFYMVALKQNDPVGIITRMRDQKNVLGEIVLQRRVRGEHLSILRFARN